MRTKGGEATWKIDQHGDKLLTAYAALFYFDLQKKITDEFWNNMIRERIHTWNSREIDDDPDAVITRARYENEQRAELLKNASLSNGKP